MGLENDPGLNPTNKFVSSEKFLRKAWKFEPTIVLEKSYLKYMLTIESGVYQGWEKTLA